MMLIFISMISVLLIVEREHRAYLTALREFQHAELEKSRENLKVSWRRDEGSLVVLVENKSPLAVKLAYIAIKDEQGGTRLMAINETIGPGHNATYRLPSSSPPKTVKVVTKRGNVFEASEASTSSSRPFKEEPPPWPQYVEGIRFDVDLASASDEHVAASKSRRLFVVSWSGNQLSEVELPVKATQLLSYSNYVAFLGSDCFGVVDVKRGEVLWFSRSDYDERRMYLEWSTGTLYVFSYASYPYFHELEAYDLATGELLGSLSNVVDVSTDGFTTAACSWDTIYLIKRGKVIGKVKSEAGAIFINSTAGEVAVSTTAQSEPPKLKFYDFSLKLLREVEVDKSCSNYGCRVEDLIWRSGGFDVLFHAWRCYDWYCSSLWWLLDLSEDGEVLAEHYLGENRQDCYPLPDSWMTPLSSGAYAYHGDVGERGVYLKACKALDVDVLSVVQSGKAVVVGEDALVFTKLPYGYDPDAMVDLEVEATTPPSEEFVLSVNDDSSQGVEVVLPFTILKAGGPSKELRVLVKLNGPSAAVKLNVSSPKGLEASINPSMGIPPFTATLTLKASSDMEPGSYLLAIKAADDNGSLLADSLLQVIVVAEPTLLIKHTFVKAQKGRLYSTLPGISYELSSYLTVKFDEQYEANLGFGGFLHEVKIPADIPTPIYIGFKQIDDYSGPEGKWEKRVMLFEGGEWVSVWSSDLADAASTWSKAHESVNGHVKPGETIYLLVGLACLSQEAPVDNVDWQIQGLWGYNYFLLVYSKDVVVVKGLLEGQVVRLRDASNDALLAEGYGDSRGACTLQVPEGTLSPTHYCYVEVVLSSGETWRSASFKVYGGDLLIFSG